MVDAVTDRSIGVLAVEWMRSVLTRFPALSTVMG